MPLLESQRVEPLPKKKIGAKPVKYWQPAGRVLVEGLFKAAPLRDKPLRARFCEIL
jgi:hypothetical protein